MFITKGENMSKEKKEYGHIAVLKDTKKRFDALCEIKGMTKDGLLRFLMEKS
jgi:hypothetical protein